MNGLSYCSIVTPVCGDGLYDPTNNEFCDDGNNNSGDGCN